MRSPSGRWLTGRSIAACGSLPSGSTSIAYSPDGKWMATASGDPGQFGAVQALARRAGRRQAGPRPAGEPADCRLRRRLQPRRQAGRRRRRRPRHPDLGGRDRQGAGADRGPRRLDLRPGLQPRRQAARQRQPRQDEQGLRRREEGVARHLPRPRPDRSTPSPSAPTARPSPPAARTTRSASGPPTTTASRSARSAASAARSSSSSYSPDGKTLVACSGDKTVRVFNAENGARLRTPPGTRRLDLHLRHLARRQDPCLGELGRRGPALEPGRRQARPDHPRRPRFQAQGRRQPRRA